MILKKIKVKNNNSSISYNCICECTYCKKIFKRNYSRIKNNINHFCNQGCMSKFNIGKLFTEERKQKISDKAKGRYAGIKNPMYGLKGINHPKYGFKESKETRRKKSMVTKGENNPMFGKPVSDETRKRISEANKGEKNGSWKGGIDKRERLEGFEYKQWRKKMFERDSYACQVCGDNKGGNLNAHHIKSYTQYPELRFDINNGITLCIDCHKEIHKKKLQLVS